MDPLIHILHLEDDPADAELARARLDEDGLSCRITRVQTREEFEEALGRAGYDIILGDYRLPTYNGMSALRLALKRCPDIPFIFVSGTMGEEAAIEGLIEGATDYVLKQKLSRLVPAIKRALQEAENLQARRWAEEALRASEKKYREFVEKANEGVWAIDASERTTFVNRRMTEMMGYAPEEMLGKTLETFMFDEELPEHRDQMAQRRQGRGGAFERRYRRKDGSEVWIQASATAVMDAKGRFTGAYALFTDITERKRVEEVQAFLAQTGSGSRDEPFFNGLARFLAGNLGMDFVCIDRLKGDGLTARTVAVWHDGHFEDNVTYALKDTPRGEVVGKTVCCFSAGVCPLFPRDPLLRDLRAESFIGVTLFNHTGEPMGLIAVIGRSPLKNQSPAEATMKMVAVRAAGELERLDAEAALKESEEKYRSMMEAMEDAVYIGSPDFRIEYQNPAMTKRIGRDATGELCYKAVHGVDEKCSWCIHEKVMCGESIKTETMSPLDRKTCIVSHSPIFHADGSVSKLAIFHDITETKKMAARLDQAQRMEAIGTLAGGIAHDFNNILFPIIGLSELLMEDLPAGGLNHENAAQIYKAGRRARDLVKQILFFSRQAEHKKAPVGIQYILKEALKLARATIPSNIEITQYIQSDCGLVMADPKQLHQIAMNLITNAYHAVEEAGGAISVNLKEMEVSDENLAGISLEAGRYAVLSISDSGCGIAPAIMGRIFEPYFTTKTLEKGTGLGLSVVYGIVKDHGGEIRVYSELGQGTTFNVYLPLLGNGMKTEAPDEPIIHETGTERILLVDDEEPIIRLEQLMLEKLGYQVTARTSSLEALAAFKATPDRFDLVITDMTMPNLMGTLLAGELKSIKPGVPIILCTGFSARINEKSAKAMGVDGFLMKPVAKSEIARMVRKVLEEGKNRKSGEP